MERGNGGVVQVEDRVVRLSVDMPEELRYRLRRAALEARVTMRDYVLSALRERLEREEERG